MSYTRLSMAFLGFWLYQAVGQGTAGEAPRLDRHGDPLPPGAIARLATTRPPPGNQPLASNEGQVFAVLFSPGGKELLTAGQGKLIHRWNLEGKLLGSFAGPNHSYLDMALSRDGKKLAVQADNLVVVVFDPVTGKERLRFQHLLPPNTLAHEPMHFHFSPDSRRVISATQGIDRFIRAWDAEDGKEIYKIDTGKPDAFNPRAMVLSSDGRTLYASHPTASIKVHDATNGKELRRIGEPGLDIVKLALSPDGRWLAAIANELHIWDAASGKELRRLPRPAQNWTGLAFSPDGRTLATLGDDKPVRLWEVSTGQLRLEIAGHRGDINCLAFSPDGRLLATGSRDKTVLLWDLRGLPLIQEKTKNSAFEQLWIDLASDDAKAALRVVCRLQGGGDKAVASLAERLKPGIGKVPQELIAQLDDEEFRVRERASRELFALGRDVEPALAKALLATTSAEVRARIRSIQERLNKGEGKATSRLRSLRILEVLEDIGTPAARKLLEAVAGGADAEVTLEAQAALKRLAERSK
jgi:sugar lactone lactonase YvrE